MMEGVAIRAGGVGYALGILLTPECLRLAILCFKSFRVTLFSPIGISPPFRNFTRHAGLDYVSRCRSAVAIVSAQPGSQELPENPCASGRGRLCLPSMFSSFDSLP
jgi:hypothetical protein